MDAAVSSAIRIDKLEEIEFVVGLAGVGCKMKDRGFIHVGKCMFDTPFRHKVAREYGEVEGCRNRESGGCFERDWLIRYDNKVRKCPLLVQTTYPAFWLCT